MQVWDCCNANKVTAKRKFERRGLRKSESGELRFMRYRWEREGGEVNILQGCLLITEWLRTMLDQGWWGPVHEQ